MKKRRKKEVLIRFIWCHCCVCINVFIYERAPPGTEAVCRVVTVPWMCSMQRTGGVAPTLDSNSRWLAPPKLQQLPLVAPPPRRRCRRRRRRRRRPVSLFSSSLLRFACCVRACMRACVRVKLVVRVARGTEVLKKRRRRKRLNSVCLKSEIQNGLESFLFLFFLFVTPVHSGAQRAFLIRCLYKGEQ